MNGEGLDAVVVGETMALMRTETPGLLQHARGFALGFGGAESNVAIGLRRLGARVGWIGRLGEDGLGDYIARELRAEGLDVFSVRDADAPTGLMLKNHRTRDRTSVSYYRAHSAGSRLSPADLPEEIIAASRLLHVTGITAALSDSARESVHAAVRIARAHGVVVSFDLNYRSSLWSREEARAEYEFMLGQTDILFASTDEAEIVTGEHEDIGALAAVLGDLGPREVVIKQGSDGACARCDGATYEQSAIQVPVVDTVGAGDAFVAGYLSEYLRGSAIDVRLLTGVRAGAFACTGGGDWEGAPYRSELELLNGTEPVAR